MGDFFSGVWSWATGSSITAALARTALVGYAAKLLAGNTDPAATPATPDTGVRQQLNPSTENQIPVLYGEAYFGGNITDAVLSSDYKKMTYCLTLAEQTGTKLSDGLASTYTFNDVYFNNNRVVFKADGITVDYTVDSSGNQDISARDLIKVYFYADTPLQPMGSSGTTPASYTVMPGWTQSTHPMTDLIYAIVEVTYNKDTNISGLPDCTFHVTNSMSLAGDVLMDYMKNSVYGAGIDSADINNSFAALNTYCTTGFTYTTVNNTVTSGIIDINGLVDTNQSVLDNMQSMAKAASSWLNYDILTGQWNITINKAGTSIASITDGNILGDITISGTSLTQLNNAADVKYQNTDILDKTDYVKISIPVGDLYPNEPITTTQIDLPFTNKQTVATKIGLQALKQARVDKIIKFKTDYSYFNLKAGDLIDVTSSIYGFTNKVFRVITAAEGEDDAGSIVCELTCLEYDAAVYDYDITAYDVTTDDGIIGIGSIGKPNTPTVTKTEQANVPKIVINAVVPSGIVDAIEYWITFDTTVQNDTARTYVKIGEYSNTGGSLLAENSTASYTYSGLSQSDFYVKVRGVNNVTSGPFSDPSGLIAYVPIVVADTISDQPVSIGGQLMTLGILTLVNNLDKLFSGSTAAGGIFDKVFEGFKNVTGVDLVGQASGGTLVVAGSGLIDGLTDVDTSTVAPEVGNVLKWDGVNWVPGTDNNDGSSGSGGTSYLAIKEKYPVDRSTYAASLSSDPVDVAMTTGDYWIKFSGINYGTLTKGTGSAKLYKSNGVLVSTVEASETTIETNLVKIPFSTRDMDTDYYIIVDAGFVKYNTTPSPVISVGAWNFHTGTPAVTPGVPKGDPVIADQVPSTCTAGAVKINSIITYSKFDDKSNARVHKQSNIGIKFNGEIALTGSGMVTIKPVSGGTHQAFNLSQTYTANKINELFWVSNDTLWINVTKDFTPGTSYYVTLAADSVVDACGINKNTAITGTDYQWTVDGGPAPKSTNTSNGVELNMNSKVTPGTGSTDLKDSGGNTVTTLDAKSPAISITEG
jgi:hypothetical protein